MTVEKLNSSSLIAMLDDDDMQSFGFEENGMSLESARFRKIILHIAELACLGAGVDHVGKRLSIDIFLPDGACWLLVAVVPLPAKSADRARKTSASNCGEVCGKFSDVSDFLTAVELIYRQNICCGKAAAYGLNGEYYLVFGYSALPSAVMRILSEFSQPVPNSARVRELGTVICPNDAVTVIGRHLV